MMAVLLLLWLGYEVVDGCGWGGGRGCVAAAVTRGRGRTRLLRAVLLLLRLGHRAVLLLMLWGSLRNVCPTATLPEPVPDTGR